MTPPGGETTRRLSRPRNGLEAPTEGAETAAGSDPATTAIGKGQIRIDTEIDLVMKQNYPVTGRKSKLRRKFPSF